MLKSLNSQHHFHTYTYTEKKCFKFTNIYKCLNIRKYEITSTRKEKLSPVWLAQFTSNGKARVIIFLFFMKSLTLLIRLIELASKTLHINLLTFLTSTYKEIVLIFVRWIIYKMECPLHKKSKCCHFWLKEPLITNQQVRRDLHLISINTPLFSVECIWPYMQVKNWCTVTSFITVCKQIKVSVDRNNLVFH
jgi:fumarate reductase subunit D